MKYSITLALTLILAPWTLAQDSVTVISSGNLIGELAPPDVIGGLFGGNIIGLDIVESPGDVAYFGVANVDIPGARADIVPFTWNGPGTPVVPLSGFLPGVNTPFDEWSPSVRPVPVAPGTWRIACFQGLRLSGIPATPTPAIVFDYTPSTGTVANIVDLNSGAGQTISAFGHPSTNSFGRFGFYSTMQLALLNGQDTVLYSESHQNSAGGAFSSPGDLMIADMNLGNPTVLGNSRRHLPRPSNSEYWHSPQPLTDAAGNMKSLFVCRNDFNDAVGSSIEFWSSASVNANLTLTVPVAVLPPSAGADYFQPACLNGTLVATDLTRFGSTSPAPERIDVFASSGAFSVAGSVAQIVAWLPFGYGSSADMLIIGDPCLLLGTPTPLQVLFPSVPLDGIAGALWLDVLNPTPCGAFTFFTPIRNGTRLSLGWPVPAGGSPRLRTQFLSVTNATAWASNTSWVE